MEDEEGRQQGLGVWTSCFNNITGQAIVTDRVITVLQHVCEVRLYSFLPRLSVGSLYSWGRATLLLFKDAIAGNVNNFYLVVSRSHVGFLRDLPALLATRHYPARVLHAHGVDVVDLLESRWYSAAARWAYGESNLIVPSKHILAYFDKTRCRVSAINNPVNVDSINGTIANDNNPNVLVLESNPTKDILHVCWNSNVMASKGFCLAFASCERLISRGFNLHFHIFGAPIGDNSMSRTKITAALNHARTAPWVTYYGQVNRTEMLRAVARSDVVVLPTFHPSESQGLAVVEAMALGCQVIASNTEVMRATTEGYPAVLVAPADADALDRALVAAQSQKHKFSSVAGSSSHYIRNKFSDETFSENIINAIFSGQHN